MSDPMHDFKYPAEGIQERLEILMALAQVLIHNSGFRDGADQEENPAAINSYGEDGIVRAIKVIATDSHRVFCKLASDLGIPK